MKILRRRFFTALFPAVPRSFPGRRALRTVVRAVHILAGGVYVGGHVFAQPPAALEAWFLAAVASGLLLLAADIHASCAVLVELRGLMVLAKLALLFCVALCPGYAVPLLFMVVLVGAISSHAPREFRHRLVFMRDRVVVDRAGGK